MDFMGGFFYGLSVCLQPINLLYCFIGALTGTLIGVLPGLGPAATISLLLPATFYLSPTSAIIMLSGIFYGAMYGGSTTAILVNIPGESASVITCLDGYAMARDGRAGPALGIAALGSFIAGTIGVIALTFIAPPIARAALKFGPPEFFGLILLGFTLLGYLSGGSMIKSFIMAALGLIIGSVGMDLFTGAFRFTYSQMFLEEGIAIIPVVMGLFGIGEVLINVEASVKREIYKTRVSNLLPTLRDWKDSIGAILRGTGLGFFLGTLPGPGHITASFASYALEKKLSKRPEQFGKGVIEGVAGPEAANNAASQGAFVPMLTLGIPFGPSPAILLAALLLHGVQPGPLLMQKSPEIFWGVIASMYIGNIMLLLLNLPLIGLWVRVVTIPYTLLFPLIVFFCLIGCYAFNYAVGDLFIMIIFGFLGYLLRKFEYPAAPLILAYILGPMFENAMRQSLMMSQGDFTIFLTRPICLVFLLTAFVICVFGAIKLRPRRIRELEQG